MSFAPLTISDLPNELLVAIAAAGQEGRVPDADSQPMISKTEWTLSHLSRRSRDVIVGAPALWTLVEANLNAEGSIEILKLYLERSRPCNIWATLRRPSVPVPDNHELIEERISKILPHVHRMWRLRIVFNTIMGGLLLAPFSDMAAPNLEHLELVNELNPWYSRWSSLGMFVRGGAPKLTFLKMNGLRLQLPLPQWVASLTHLELLRGQTPAELDTGLERAGFTSRLCKHSTSRLRIVKTTVTY
ncbi:hypothetical protein B0H19DRAFT_1231411 [Mycena capillaripes]|nr:hypothetical protein B0H19DRAFT_1231411 [Mycena capillaripes]